MAVHRLHHLLAMSVAAVCSLRDLPPLGLWPSIYANDNPAGAANGFDLVGESCVGDYLEGVGLCLQLIEQAVDPDVLMKVSAKNLRAEKL